MQPRKDRHAPQRRPEPLPCPHCGQVIDIGNDELAGDEEVVRLRMNHPCPGAPTSPADADRSEQLRGPGTGLAVGEWATTGPGRPPSEPFDRPRSSSQAHPNGVVRDARQPHPAQQAYQASGPAPTRTPGRLTLGGAVLSVTPRHTRTGPAPPTSAWISSSLSGGRALVRPGLSRTVPAGMHGSFGHRILAVASDASIRPLESRLARPPAASSPHPGHW